MAQAAATSSDNDIAGASRREVKERQTQKQTQVQTHRKQRRCWSPKLHRSFLQALEQLGGSHGMDVLSKALHFAIKEIVWLSYGY